MKSMVRDVSEWCMRPLVCNVKEVSSILKFTEKRIFLFFNTLFIIHNITVCLQCFSIIHFLNIYIELINYMVEPRCTERDK